MAFHSRLALLAAVAVTVALALAGVGIYVYVAQQLRGQIDDSLSSLAYQVAGQPQEQPFQPTQPVLGGASGYEQIVSSKGGVSLPAGATVALPVNNETLEVAAGKRASLYRNVYVNGVHLRVLAIPLGPNAALQLARPLDEVDHVLARLKAILIGVALIGVALAAFLGALVSRLALAPVRRLTKTTAEIARTRDLSRRADASGHDDLARLSASFNAMLEALSEAALREKRLVSDASHELRTPLTSLRTNLDLLVRGTLSAEESVKALADSKAQAEELSQLVADVVELAREGEQQGELETVALDDLVARCVKRAERDSGTSFTTQLLPCRVEAAPDKLERAIKNLLANAAAWHEGERPIEVSLALNGDKVDICVRDHGPGIAAADRPYVFDRFWRSPQARGRSGSGLGLAIVRQTAESHGGTVTAEAAPGGGALLRLTLPLT